MYIQVKLKSTHDTELRDAGKMTVFPATEEIVVNGQVRTYTHTYTRPDTHTQMSTKTNTHCIHITTHTHTHQRTQWEPEEEGLFPTTEEVILIDR